MKPDGFGRRNRGFLALVFAATGTLAACAATPPSSESLAPTAGASATGTGASLAATTTASAIPTAGKTPAESPSTTPSVTPGGYHWVQVDPAQFGGVGLQAVTATPDARLFAIGDWVSAEAPDGTPRHPTAWTSSDGSAWFRQPDSQGFVSRRSNWEEVVLDIVPDGPGFVAVGMEQLSDASTADAAAWFSPDARTWTRAKVADGIGRTMDQVVATDTGFVAIGEAGYDFHGGFGAGTAIWTSPDGRTWTRLADKAAPPRGTALGSIVAGGVGFLATASFEYSQGVEVPPRQPLTAGIWRSNDAIHWTPIPGAPLGVGQIVRVPDGFVAFGTGYTGDVAHPVSWRSRDGRTWTPVEVPPPDDLPDGTSVYGHLLVNGTAGLLAFGARDDNYTTVGWSSPDGTVWTPLDPGAILAGTTIERARALGGSILLLGDRSNAATSDPVTWRLSP